MRLALFLTLAAGFLYSSPHSATAYNLFPFTLGGGETGYAKWGGDNHAGTPGGAVTWSLMPTGTTLDASAPTYLHGTSDLTPVFNQVGGQAAALAMIQSALDRWSTVANIEFVYVGIDDGTPFSAPYAPGQVLGDIRIGAFEIDGFSAAVGFTAPPNGGTTLEGDVIFNNKSDISFYVAPEAEGELYDLYPPGGGFYRNEFEGLAAHELGHALGLAHSDVSDGLMCGYVDSGFDGSLCSYFDPDGDGKAPVNRIPDPDDVDGVQFLYGPPPSADFDNDGDVDGQDFLVWQRGNSVPFLSASSLVNWQAQYETGSLSANLAVPEPSLMMMTCILGCILSCSREFKLSAAMR
ncbi:matrixin family metalloprotease [Bythopirellula goksoeyrii]|uniref:Matrixin n=1 Tax=Bythopirellula goksoeyrii TaxID=1400387 RepID=A0A5B9QK58_9BACT|nr:matrixin family metalloprotease [Bythopirellula goksoeyrii]QEG37915.1 Matrixin [Bythopirellula goksoeyrii]